MTEEKKSMVPKLRFPGFNETWEQRKLGDFAEKVTEKNTELRYSEVFTNSAEFGVIRQRDFFDHDIAQLRSLHGYYVVKEDDFVYNPRISVTAPVGPINRNKLGKTGVVSPLYTVLRTQGINREFLEWFFKSSCWYPFMLFNGDSGARSDRFSIKNALFFRMPIALPCQAEQMKIGLFFERLDKAITLHQRKLEGLSKLKKSLLQKMFPKNGQQNPEVRFPGFTEAWEQRKLGELAATFGYGLNAAAKSFDGRHKYIRITDIDESTRRFLCSSLTSPDIDFEEAAPYRLAEGDVLFARTGASVGKSYRYVRTDGEVYFAGFLIRFRFKDKEAAEFVFQNSLTAKFQNFIKTSSQRSGQPGINAQQFSGYQIAVPNSEERERIGSFFSRLDTAITLHQRKLESLKILKKSLLQQMFV